MCLTAGTGVALFAWPDRTADYWAWTIKASPTAAFFGAGYLGAAIILGLAAVSDEWRRVRVVAVAAFTLTSLALFVSLQNLETFAFGEGGLTETVAWVWLAVYALLPPLVLAAFALQERAGGAREGDVDAPALGATRVAFAAAGALLGALGVGLLAGWDWLVVGWPWPLPPLPAGIAGAWLCTYAAAFLWFALREQSWRNGRIAVLPALIVLALDLMAAVRLRDSFDGGGATTAYIVALSALFVLLGTIALIEERRS